MNPNQQVKIKVRGGCGRTAVLRPDQARVVQKTFSDMMTGKLSLPLANDLMISRLKEASLPVEFDDAPADAKVSETSG